MMLLLLHLGCRPQTPTMPDSGTQTPDDTDTPQAPPDTDTPDTDTDPPTETGTPPPPLSLRLEASPTHSTTVPDAAIWNSVCVVGDTLRVSSAQHQKVYLYEYDLELNLVGDSPLPRTLLIESLPQGQLADFAMACYGDALYIAACDSDADDLYIAGFTADGAPLGELQTVSKDSERKTNDMHILADDRGVHLLWGDSSKRRQRQTFTHDLKPLDFSQLVLPVMTAQLGSTRSVDGGYWMFTGDKTNHQVQLTRLTGEWVVEDWAIIIPEEEPSWNWFPSGSVRHEATGYWLIAYNQMPDDSDPKEDAKVRIATLDADLVLQDIVDVTESNGFTRPHLALHEDTLFLTYDGDEVYLKAFDLIVE